MKKVRCLNSDCSILIKEELDKEKFESIKKNGCLDCGSWEIEFEPEDSGEEGEIKLITTKCLICSKLKGVEIPDWNTLVEKYKEVEGFPKSKEQAIFNLCWNIFEKEFCQCLKCFCCEKYFIELFENKYCEACAKESFFYSCKFCQKKFPFNEPKYAELSYQEVKQRVGEDCIKHQEECSIINPQVKPENIKPEDNPFSGNETEDEPISNDDENHDERQSAQIEEIEEEENESQSDNQATPIFNYFTDVIDISPSEEQEERDSSSGDEDDSTLNTQHRYERRFTNFPYIPTRYTNPDGEGWRTMRIPRQPHIPTPYTESAKAILIKIKNELNKFPNVPVEELLVNRDYENQIINLQDDIQRENYLQKVIDEISQIRSESKTLFEQIITNVQEILDNDNLIISEDSLQREIETLKTIIIEINNSFDREDWEREKLEAERLLKGLRAKLSKITNQNPIPNDSPQDFTYIHIPPFSPSPEPIPIPTPQPQPRPIPQPNSRPSPQPTPPESPVPEKPERPEPTPQKNPTPPETPPLPNPPPNDEQAKKYGEDFASLKASQQEGRIKTEKKWKEEDIKNPNYQRNFCCSDCQKKFAYDKSSINFLSSQQKAKNELKEHQKTCPLKNNADEQKRLAQEDWDKVRKSKTRNLFSCGHCWGKVIWDKSIIDAEQARKQALADINFHEKEECGVKEKKDWMVAIYFSPNQGGNQHAPLSYANERADLILEEDNQGEVYQEKQQSLPLPVKILIGGGVTMFVLLIGYLVIRFSKNRKNL